MEPEGHREVGHSGDPLIACIAELAARFGIAFRATSLASLPRDREGYLPFHQADEALETVGLNFEPGDPGRLPRSPDDYPVLAETRSDDGARNFVVLHEKKGREVLVWRPGGGEAAWERFDTIKKEQTGNHVLVHGNPDAIRGQDSDWQQKSRFHWFWSELRKERRGFRPVLLASFLINLLALALPLFSMNVYDRVIPNRAVSTLWVLAIGVLIAFALEYALRTARANVVDQIGRRLDLRLSQKIFGRLLETPLSAKQGHTGSLAARVSEYTIVRDFFASTTIVLMVDLLFLFVFVATIAYIAGWLALVPVVIIIAMLIAGFILQRKVVEAAQNAQTDHGLQQTVLVESLAGMETLKSMAGEGTMMSRWHRLADMGSRSQQRLRHISSLATGLATTFQQLSSILLVIGGYYLFDAGKITMGAIIAIVMLSSRSLAPAGQIAFLLTRGRQANETLNSIERIFENDDERRMGSVSTPATIRSADIALENLSFSYPDASTEALTDISLKIAPGERIGVIGRVASGKSTLGRIVCGLYQPTEGAMLIDGIDSRQFRPHDVREAFRFVGQDANLFTGTVKENLELGSVRPGDEQMMRALRITGADQFLARDAGGFDRLVGEHGRRLSGGQRSFLSLARAFVSPARLLFLDEPTGAMDSQTEKLFVQRLSEALSRDQTLLISTHRPALFSLCDRLIILDKGKVVADGPKAEILSAAREGGNLAHE